MRESDKVLIDFFVGQYRYAQYVEYPQDAEEAGIDLGKTMICNHARHDCKYQTFDLFNGFYCFSQDPIHAIRLAHTVSVHRSVASRDLAERRLKTLGFDVTNKAEPGIDENGSVVTSIELDDGTICLVPIESPLTLCKDLRLRLCADYGMFVAGKNEQVVQEAAYAIRNRQTLTYVVDAIEDAVSENERFRAWVSDDDKIVIQDDESSMNVTESAMFFGVIVDIIGDRSTFDAVKSLISNTFCSFGRQPT